MKITEITVYSLQLQLIKPYYMSRGRIFDKLGSTFVKISTDADIDGWSEVCPWGSNYLPAFPGGVRAALDEIAPHLIGEEPRRPEVVTRIMDSVLAGHLYAKAAIDYALWDIMGKAASLPVYDLLGGKYQDNPVPLISTNQIDSPQNMLTSLNYWREKGYTRHSIKLGGGVDADIALLKAIAPERKEGEEFIFDVNGGWMPWEAIRVLNATRDVEYWIEQPCITYEECATVRSQTGQAMSLDECIFEVRDVVRAIQDKTIDFLNIKIARVGGLTRARWIRDLCMAYDIPIVVMDMAGTVMNEAVVAHFAQSLPGNRCFGAWACHEMLTTDVAPGRGARNINGFMAPPSLPGLGVEPDVEMLGEPVARYR